MGHGDDHDLIDRELLGKPAKPSRRHLRRSMHGCPAQLLDSLLLSRRKRAGSELGGSGKGPVEGAVAIKPPMRTRKKEALGPFRGRCGVDPYAQACQRSRAISARLEGRAIGIARFCATVAVVKEVCIAIGQPELRGELRGQRRAAEKPVARLPRAAARGPPRKDGRQASAALATRRSRRQGRPRRNLDLPPSADGPPWQASAHSWSVDRPRGRGQFRDRRVQASMRRGHGTAPQPSMVHSAAA